MEFRERRVLILIKTPPIGRILCAEGWRAATGMFGLDHQPTILFIGDSVYSLLKSMNDSRIRMFKSTFKSFDGRAYASRRSLDERGISTSEMIEDVEIADEATVGRLFAENELVITF